MPLPSGSTMTWFARLFLPCTAIVAALVLLAGEAMAHASLVSSEPADGAMLGEMPAELRLVFTEPVSPIVLKLVGPEGAGRLDKYRLQGSALVIEAPAGLARGSYALSWRVSSVDGHPVGGTTIFSVGSPGPSVPAAAIEASTPLRPLIWLTRLALYLGLFVGVGGLAFDAFVAPSPGLAVRLSKSAMALGLAALLPAAALQGLDLVGVGFDRLKDPEVWSAALSSTYMVTLLLAGSAMGVGLLAWSMPSDWRPTLSAVALAALGLALAASGHASAAPPRWLTRPAVFLHGVGIAIWVGSLVPLALNIGRGGDPARRALARFSRIILPVVAVLALAGAVLAVVQLRHFEALWTTAYGRVLLAKLSLLLLLFTLAAINRFSLTPAVQKREPKAARQFTRSVRMEFVLAALILGVASFWRFTPPPRSLVAVAEAPVSVHLHSAKAMAELTISPGRAGPVSAAAYVMSGDFGPLDAKEVTLAFSLPAAGIEPVRRSMRRLGDGRWQLDAVSLPAAGEWTVEVDILISDFDRARLRGEMPIKR